MKIRVMLVDDHPEFLAGLRRIINREKDMEVVGEAGTGEEAVSKARDLRPDVILMDVKMPGMGGANATRQILSDAPGTKILALTIYELDEFRDDMMRAGASGYILKDCEVEELTGAIRKF